MRPLKHVKVVNNSGCVGMPEKWRRLESLRCSGWKPLPLWVATLREGHTLTRIPFARMCFGKPCHSVNRNGAQRSSEFGWKKHEVVVCITHRFTSTSSLAILTRNRPFVVIHQMRGRRSKLLSVLRFFSIKGGSLPSFPPARE